MQRAVLLAVAACLLLLAEPPDDTWADHGGELLVEPSITATSDQPGKPSPARNRPPVVKFHLAMDHLAMDPLYAGVQDYLDLSEVRDPDGRIATMRLTVDGHAEDLGTPPPWRGIYFKRSGVHSVRIDATDNEGATASNTLLVGVLEADRYTSTGSLRSLVGPRFSLFVPRYFRAADANREGIPVKVVCKYTCRAGVELQMTRYRARKLGLRPPRRRRLTVAGDAAPYYNWEHHFLLRPNARVRRALRRARKVPLLLRVTSFGGLDRQRTTQAEIELTGARHRRR